MLTLLTAFDAMRQALHGWWIADGRCSDQVATLCGSLEPIGNGQPLDIALWFDWLDALNQISPQDEIASSIAESKEHWRKFNIAAKIKDVEERRRAFQQLSASKRSSWHICGDLIVDKPVANAAFGVFLNMWWMEGLRGEHDIARLIADHANGKLAL